MKNFGLLGSKMGMSQIDVEGVFTPVTLVWVENPTVLGFKTVDKDGYSSVILGSGSATLKKWNKAQHGIVSENEKVSSMIREFRISDLSEFAVGDVISVEKHFPFGSFVDVQGFTLGRGFTGPMKRYGFAGLRASHGVSVSHRSHGSTGCRKPSKVFKGKKMAGRYGNEKVTTSNIKVVYSKDSVALGSKNGSIIGIHGSIPGAKGSRCSVYQSLSLKERLK